MQSCRLVSGGQIHGLLCADQGRGQVALRGRDPGHLEMAVGETGPLPQHPVAQDSGLGVFLGVDQLRQLLVRAEESDEILGVFLASVEGDFRGGAATAQVSERLQTLPRGTVEAGVAAGLTGSKARRDDPLELAAHRIGASGFLLKQIVGFSRVVSEVVELGARGLDELPTVHDHSEKGAGAVVGRGSHRLGVERPSSQAGAIAGEPGRKVETLGLLLGGGSHQTGDGGHDVDQAHRLIDLSGQSLPPRHPEDEGHLESALVDEEAMIQFAVFSEHLPVIAGDDDERRVVEPQVLELLDDLAHAVIREGHLSGVGVVGPPGSEGLGRLIGVVRIVVVDE